jgi:hypothetical protein
VSFDYHEEPLGERRDVGVLQRAWSQSVYPLAERIGVRTRKYRENGLQSRESLEAVIDAEIGEHARHSSA